jgi:hypothetical protein
VLLQLLLSTAETYHFWFSLLLLPLSQDGGVLRPVHSAMPIARTLFENPQLVGNEVLLTLWNENPTAGHAVLGKQAYSRHIT